MFLAVETSPTPVTFSLILHIPYVYDEYSHENNAFFIRQILEEKKHAHNTHENPPKNETHSFGVGGSTFGVVEFSLGWVETSARIPLAGKTIILWLPKRDTLADSKLPACAPTKWSRSRKTKKNPSKPASI